MNQTVPVYQREYRHLHKEKIERALIVAANLIERYADSEFEEYAIRIYERLENELAKFNKNRDVRKRARRRIQETIRERV